jgi:hypothetical protein
LHGTWKIFNSNEVFVHLLFFAKQWQLFFLNCITDANYPLQITDANRKPPEIQGDLEKSQFLLFGHTVLKQVLLTPYVFL